MQQADKYYVFSSGGKQYIIDSNKPVWIDYIVDAQEGQIIERPLLLNSKTGLVNGNIKLKVNGVTRGEKLLIQKHKRRKHHEKRTGFRSFYTSVSLAEENK